MRVDAFDYVLPPERIALRPVEPRENARLLSVTPGEIDPFMDSRIEYLPKLLRTGDCLVVNDTRVLPARLIGTRRRGETQAAIQATLHKREDDKRWRAFVRPAKKLSLDDKVLFQREKAGEPLLATVVEKGEAGEIVFSFSLSGEALDTAIRRVGIMPLPPYIAAKRTEDARDELDYQTMFADRSGAVAAPTAGLHFTPNLLNSLKNMGILMARVTLHVGAGTFLPVKVDDTADHHMHAEWGEITESTAEMLNATRARGGRIVSVGTTSLRLLESAIGDDGVFRAWSGDTSIFITPGYRFKAVDVLLTNFHLPRSTLFMLVSAFSGLDTMQKAYKHAIDTGYRFYSYGDACLLHRAV